MKKFLLTLFITISLSGLLVPVVSFAATATEEAAAKARSDEVATRDAKAAFEKSYNDSVAANATAKANPTPENITAAAAAQAKFEEDSKKYTDAAFAAPKSEAALNTTLATEAAQNKDNNGACSGWGTGWMCRAMDYIGNAILGGAAWILWACGTMLNLSIVQFVIEMRDRIGEIGAIYVIWQRVRDLANMFFIFILLYIAIQTILRMGDYKKALRNVVLVALFINFSFFFTGVTIDASNMLALQFYNGFAGGCGNLPTNTGNSIANVANATKNAAAKKDGCISQKVVSSLKLATIYDVNAAKKGETTTEMQGLSSSQGIGRFWITVGFGSFLMLIAAGVFIASAILIFYRFIELILLLMFSPIAFAALILPATEDYWNKWKGKLIKQLIFAPAYFMFLWVTMAIIESKVVKTDGSFTSGFNGDGTTLFGLMASFIIVIAMLTYSLTLAKDLGAKGTKMATKWSKGLSAEAVGGFLGRNTAGRAASRIANSQAMQNIVKTAPIIGRLAQKPFDSIAKASFGGKKDGFVQAEKDQIKQAEEQAKRFGPSSLMIENVENERKAASKNLDDQRRIVRNTVNAKYLADEKEIAKLEENATDPKTSKEETTRLMGVITEKKKALADKKDKDTVEMLKPHEGRDLKARNEADRILGVKKDEAKRRGEELGKERGFKGKELEEFTQKIAKDNGLDRKELEKQGRDAGLEGVKLEKFVENAINEKRGLKKNQQEGFAKMNKLDYGAIGSKMEAKTIQKKMLKAAIRTVVKPVGSAINFVTNRPASVEGSANIEKNVIKEKSAAEQMMELAKKESGSAAKPEPKGGDSESKKDGEENKPKAA
jgi:hypothetical protein